MTGYATYNLEIDNFLLQIELKSVNHRFLDINIKAPEELRFLEYKMRNILQANLGRGKIELRIQFKDFEPSLNSATLILNHDLLANYCKLAAEIMQQYREVTTPASVAEIMNYPGILTSKTLDPNFFETKLETAIYQLINELNLTQQKEGEQLLHILLHKLELMEENIKKAKAILPQMLENYKSELKQKLIEVLEDTLLNEQRLAQEFAYVCQKVDVEEELDRLKSHITHFKELILQDKIKSIGKKLDFITQEMHREANTFGSKSTSLNATHIALELKVLVEQIKEQVQNIM